MSVYLFFFFFSPSLMVLFNSDPALIDTTSQILTTQILRTELERARRFINRSLVLIIDVRRGETIWTWLYQTSQ